MPPVQFAKMSYQAESLPLSAQRLVNLYAEAAPPDAKSNVVLLGSPGIKSFATAGTAGTRGMHVLAGVLYVVAGVSLYRINISGGATDLGFINGSGHVSMDDNGVQLCIVNGIEGYIYTVSGGLVQITDPDFTPADFVTFQDGYFIFRRTGTAIFFISNLNDGTAYLATDFATAEGDADTLITVISNHRELWLFGAATTEIWYNSGNLDFPFERLAGPFIERGCAAGHSVIRIDNTLMWLGEDRVVYRASGFNPQRISQHAIEKAFERYTTISDAFAFTYTMSGHKVYVLTFPSAKATWVFDSATSLWHERESLGLDGRWRANTYATAYGKHLVGDSENGNVGELDPDTYAEYGSAMQGIATAPPAHFDRKRVFFRRFELDVESGVGLTAGQGSDPLIALDWSDDGGRTYSARKPPRSIGKIGAYRQRLRWNRMGMARNRIYRAIVSDPVKRAIVAAHLEATSGTS